MAPESELHYRHHPHHPHHYLLLLHHPHQNAPLLPNITSSLIKEDNLITSSNSNSSVISNEDLTLPPLEVVLFRALLAQLFLGLVANFVLFGSVVAANRRQSASHAHRQSLYASVASARGANLAAHRLTPVVDQILALLAATAILRLLTRAGLQVLCFYGACTFFTPLPCSSFHGFLNTFLHTLHLWVVALLLQDRYIAHQDPSSYLSKCSHTVLYVTLIGVGFLATMHYLAPVYGFSAYRFVTGEHTCTIDWLAHYSCPYWVYSLLLLWGPALGAIACWTTLLTCHRMNGYFSALSSFCTSFLSCLCCCFCLSSSSSSSTSSSPRSLSASPVVEDYQLPPSSANQEINISSSTNSFFNKSTLLQSKSHLLPSCCRFSSSQPPSTANNSNHPPSVPPNSTENNSLETATKRTLDGLVTNSEENSSLTDQRRKTSSTKQKKVSHRIFCKHGFSRQNGGPKSSHHHHHHNSYSSYNRSSTGSNELRAEAYHSLSPSLLQIGSVNDGGGVAGSNSNYVLSSHTSSSFTSTATLSHHSRSNVLTPSQELASVAAACWLFLVATLPKLIDSGCQACLTASPYPMITDETPNPRPVFETAKRSGGGGGGDFEIFFEKSFLISYLDETTSCVLIPLLLLTFHSRLRFSLILIIAYLLGYCRLPCRRRRGQHRRRKCCWSFGQSSATATTRSSRSSSLRKSRSGGVNSSSAIQGFNHHFHHHLPTFHLSASSSAASSRQASLFPPPPPPVFSEPNCLESFSRSPGNFLRVSYPNSNATAAAAGERSLAVTIM